MPIFDTRLSDTRFLAEHFRASALVMQAVCADEAFLASCGAVTAACAATLRDGGKILLAGNGGSAGDAQHIAGEFVARLNFDRAPLAALALTVDTSVLTAIGNDYGFDQIFSRQVTALAQPGDVLIAISTSGRSPNILRALEAARARGATTIGFAGRGGGEMAALCDIVLAVPSAATPLIQQVHIAAAHAICGAVEAMLFQRPAESGAMSAAAGLLDGDDLERRRRDTHREPVPHELPSL